jgi:aminoglycoside 3-N-acetyltransferase
MSDSMISREELRTDFTNLGIKAGDHVALGMSFGAVGMVSGGPQSFVEALLDAIGTGGTIMIPTFTYVYPLSLVRRRKVPVFSRDETVPYTGVVANHIRSDGRAIRSGHPTNSFAAIGGKADYLLGDHNHEAGAYSPYSRLADIDGKVLIIGLDYRLIGIRHEAQSRAGLLHRIPPYTGALFLDEGGVERVFVRKDLGGCVTRLPDMIGNLKEADIVTEGPVGKAKAVVVPARDSLDIMTGLLQRNPERYLCGSARCLWCRETERRLQLCGRLSHKRWFQRNSFLRFPLDAYNHLRLKDIAVLTVGKYLLLRVVRRLLPRLTAKQRISVPRFQE